MAQDSSGIQALLALQKGMKFPRYKSLEGTTRAFIEYFNHFLAVIGPEVGITDAEVQIRLQDNVFLLSKYGTAEKYNQCVQQLKLRMEGGFLILMDAVELFDQAVLSSNAASLLIQQYFPLLHSPDEFEKQHANDQINFQFFEVFSKKNNQITQYYYAMLRQMISLTLSIEEFEGLLIKLNSPSIKEKHFQQFFSDIKKLRQISQAYYLQEFQNPIAHFTREVDALVVNDIHSLKFFAFYMINLTKYLQQNANVTKSLQMIRLKVLKSLSVG